MLTPLDLKLINCKEKLINLTRQNNLLFYKKRKSSTLVVKTEDKQSLYNQILDEKMFGFWEFPEEQKEGQGDTELEGHPGLFQEQPQPEQEAGVDWLAVKPPKDNEIVCDFSSNDELRKILKNLYRRARTEYEERGLNISYIFFGLAEWSDKQNSDRVKSPLIMIPIQFEHKSTSEAYKISVGDDEVILNPALRVKFKKDFNVLFPELEGSPEDWDLESYFADVEKQMAPLNVKVYQEVHIGLFSFHKLVMYSDYEKHHDLMKQHLLISCFGQDGNIDIINSTGSDAIEHIDDNKELKRQFSVLDADSSQQRCIEAARAGASFVMVGPPGTGKSQTIANIVAELIKEGKSVLFVSEKMAALEVVFKRLKECDLADFCLELHSHKANKKQVITELGKSLSERIVPRETIADIDYKQFLRMRERLNAYLLALHLRREPLGMSIYEVLGCLAAIEQIAYIPTRLPNGVQGITPESLIEFDALFDSLESLWDVFIKGNDFSWYGFKGLSYTPALKYRLEELLSKIISQSSDLLGRVNAFELILGLPPAVSLRDFRKISEVLDLLAQNVYVPASWTEHFDYQQIVAVIQKSKEAKQRFCISNDYISQRYAEGFFALNDNYLESLVNSLRELQVKIGVQDYQIADLIRDFTTVREALRLFEETLRRLLSNQEIVWQELDMSAIKSLKSIEMLCKAVTLIFDDEKRPELSWFDPALNEELKARVKVFEQQAQEIKILEKDLLARYKSDILGLEVERLLRLFEKNGFYRTFVLKYLSPQYHQDAKKIIQCSLKSGKIVPRLFFDDLVTIKKLTDLRQDIQGQEVSDRRLFGRFYIGEKTQFEAVYQAFRSLDEARALIEKLGLSVSHVLIEKLQIGDLRQRCSAMAGEMASQDRKIFEFLIKKGFPIVDIKSSAIPDFLTTLSQTISSMSSLQAILPPLQNCLLPGDQFPSVQEIEEARRNFREWCSVKDNFSRQSGELKKLFGHYYNDVNTDWLFIENVLQWYQLILTKLGSLPQNGKLAGLLVANNAREIDGEQLSELKQLIETVSVDGSSLWAEFNAVSFKGKDISWEDGNFSLVMEKSKQLKECSDDLKLWIDWQGLNLSLGKAGLENFLSGIYNARDQIFPEQIRQVFRKAIYSEWLNTVYATESALKDFRGEDHTKVREKFVELDIKLSRLSRALVIQSANERKPVMLNGSSGGSQVGILRREMAKQKRHKPIKRLFAEIFDLISKLKRCFLMSPISVCQYLEPGKFKFDLVIFDEASQICVEDAVPSILRGAQMIIAGDNKQLPPTSFFKAEDQYEFDEDEVAFDIENLESILDECRGLGLKEHMLKWHYRSRHEDLITYSNYKFYGRELVTFPSAIIDDEHLGVKFEYVENAVYDRGGRRDNQAEAKRVVELVFEHFKKYPNKSIGVVTLSIAQKEAVEDAIELKLRENPEFAKFFTESRLEGVFVKNLENVQGDERDVIIFCVGYGKDVTGRLSMNFGPLNKLGGERRLNVLITRAREKNIVVASIKAADFDPNIASAGVMHLRNYLAYAEKGMDFLNTEGVVKMEDFDSPLEENVASAVRQLGYEVSCQVGCAGYRIDLGIIDPANPERFILGVECDGATYHSSHSARDRDRLRQAVLEKMGWTIHRIWSPDWVHKRSIEVERLKNVIESARFDRRDLAQKKQEAVHPSEPIKHDVIGNSQDGKENGVFGEDEYYLSEADRHFKPEDFYSYRSGEVLFKQLQKIIQCEAPIHTDLLFRRIMSYYNLGRMGDRIQVRLTEILQDIAKQKKDVHLRGSFVYTDGVITARRPNPNYEETRREIEHIAPEEIRDAMVRIVRLNYGVTMDCLFAETLKFFGFIRQTDAVVRLLKQNAKKLVSVGKFILKDNFFVVKED